MAQAQCVNIKFDINKFEHQILNLEKTEIQLAHKNGSEGNIALIFKNNLGHIEYIQILYFYHLKQNQIIIKLNNSLATQGVIRFIEYNDVIGSESFDFSKSIINNFYMSNNHHDRHWVFPSCINGISYLSENEKTFWRNEVSNVLNELNYKN